MPIDGKHFPYVVASMAHVHLVCSTLREHDANMSKIKSLKATVKEQKAQIAERRNHY